MKPINEILIPRRIPQQICLLLSICLLSACSSKPTLPSKEEQAQKLAMAWDNGGYKFASASAINSYDEIWIHDGAEIEVVMTAPSVIGNYPLLIYLPSLGEDAQAGRLWRETWAKAGYAVFSMQPLAIGEALKELEPERGTKSSKKTDASSADENADVEEDEKSDSSNKSGAKRSKSARNSELRYIGHEYFAVDALKQRMEQLFWVYAELKRRVAAGQSVYVVADTSKVILAGYDLGAQTVAAVLGENFAAQLPSNNDLKPAAAILLSPSIDLAEGNVRSRFQKLNLPLLVVTGSEDNDPYAISSASVRAAVWEFSPPGNKYLLLLTGGVHQLLTGADMGGRFGKAEIGFGRGILDGLGGGKFADLSQQYGSGSGGGRGKSGGWQGRGEGNAKDHANNADMGYKQVAAVFSTSTAFIDKVVKNDEFAQFWLDVKAEKWLDRAGSLQYR